MQGKKQGASLFKTFNFGFFLGLVGTAILLWYVPVVDQHREGSLISVQPNGGNAEVFRINLPRDRILGGAAGATDPVPAGLEWPAGPLFANSQTELFKLRDRRETVVGVASRVASTDADEPFIQWMLHLPARGTMFLDMTLEPSADGYRDGRFLAGTREFAELTGNAEERFVGLREEGDEGEFDVDAYIELKTALVSLAVDYDPAEPLE
ncbi:MAG: hypothetical protein KJO31_18890 [Gammaproteobacteria bacterium]|nr:hypothetical protein [Gammaproteobacteria bacterium]